MYAALAFELEGVRKRAVPPLWRSGAAEAAISGDRESQLSGVEHEPGARQQL